MFFRGELDWDIYMEQPGNRESRKSMICFQGEEGSLWIKIAIVVVYVNYLYIAGDDEDEI